MILNLDIHVAFNVRRRRRRHFRHCRHLHHRCRRRRCRHRCRRRRRHRRGRRRRRHRRRRRRFKSRVQHEEGEVQQEIKTHRVKKIGKGGSSNRIGQIR